MRLSTTVVYFALVLPFLPVVFGHGQVRNFITSTNIYASADAYAAVADPNSPIRKLNTYGPAADFTSNTITCGEGGNVPVTPLAEVQAGELVTFDWGSWTSSHSGPVMTYIAKCPNGCANFKGDTGNVWVKIDQDQYNPTRTGFEWGENIIRMKGSKYSVHIPNLVPGEYLLRHEILGLHVAGQLMGAQFYPNCVQIKITGSGTLTLPTGIPLPGSYDPEDPGILVQLWQYTPQNPYYVAPGGSVLLPGGTGDWGIEEYGGGVVTRPSNSSSTSQLPGTTTSQPATITSIPPAQPTTPITPPPTPTGSAVQKYGQCGGQGRTGLTNCVSGTTCTKLNDYYAQCL
ncbi:family 61 endoglucanase [Abortiporus biennis]|nr:family 61 endoglucanase [Abortiporus biennis]